MIITNIIINGTNLNDIKEHGIYNYALNIDIDSLPTITLPRYLIRITDKNGKVSTHDLGLITKERAMYEYQNYIKSYPECECALFMKGGYKNNE